MRILMISSDCVPNSGGIAAVVQNLSCSLRELGVDVWVVGCSNKWGQLGRFDAPMPNFRVRPVFKTRFMAGASAFMWNATGMARVLRETTIDILHAHVIPADGWVLRLFEKRARLIITNHYSGFLDLVKNSKRRRLLRFLFRKFDAVLAPSVAQADASTYLGVPRKAIYYIPNGVDVSRFTSGDPNPKVWNLLDPFTSQHRIILAARRLVRKNGLHFLIQALPRVISSVSGARLVIAGDGPEAHSLRKQALKLGVSKNIKFLGHCPPSVMPDIYKAADICVLPSLSEVMSIGALEAMATGKPLLATRVGGIGHVVSDRISGHLIEPENVREIEAGIIQILQDADYASRLSKNASEQIQNNFTWHSAAGKTLRIYERVLKQGPNG